MAMTMTQKILARSAGLDHVEPGQLIEGKLDLVLGNDITTPVAITEFEKAGLTSVFDRGKIAIVLDHSTPCKDIKSAQLCAKCREFAKKFAITHFYDVGHMGVEHALIPEKGLAAPGEVIIGADSTPVLTALWARSPPAWVPLTWQPAWPPGPPGSRCPRLSKST